MPRMKRGIGVLLIALGCMVLFAGGVTLVTGAATWLGAPKQIDEGTPAQMLGAALLFVAFGVLAGGVALFKKQ